MLKPISTNYFTPQSFFIPESLYNNASVTWRKNVVSAKVLKTRNQIPYPFNLLKVIKTKGSSGKCWMFHKNKEGKFMGYLFPSGNRIVGMKSLLSISGEFFYGKQNFQSSKYGLLGALLPEEPITGKIYECKLILISKLYEDEHGEVYLKY